MNEFWLTEQVTDFGFMSQRRGVCSCLYNNSKEAPNSQCVKVARVRLTNSKVNSYIRRGLNTKALNRVGSRCRVKDSYVITLRGTLDTAGVANRTQRRSKYGAKRPKAKK